MEEVIPPATATAMGVDDDGQPVMAADSAAVTIDNVPPLANLTKTVTAVLVTYAVEVCNASDAEELTLIALDDRVGRPQAVVRDDLDVRDALWPTFLVYP